MSTAFYNPFLWSTYIANPQINSKRDNRKYELRTLISIESTYVNVWYDQTNLPGFRWLISCRAIISSILHCFHLFFFYSSKPTNDRNCDEHTIKTWCLLRQHEGRIETVSIGFMASIRRKQHWMRILTSPFVSVESIVLKILFIYTVFPLQLCYTPFSLLYCISCRSLKHKKTDLTS